MHTDHMLASRWTESENPSTHDPVVPGKIRSCRGSELDVTAEPSVNHTLAWAFFVCAWILFKGGVWGGEKKKFVQLINPMIKDNRIEEEEEGALRWQGDLRREEKKEKWVGQRSSSPNWYLSFVTLRASDLTRVCVCVCEWAVLCGGFAWLLSL